MNLRKTAFTVVLLSLVSAGCAQKNLGVGAAVLNCCPGNTEAYTAFSLTLEDLPAFLNPVMEQEFTAAFEKKGLVRDDVNSDLTVHLKLLRQDLNEPVPKDDFKGHLAPGDSTRFLADLLIEMYDQTTNELIWSGTIGRIHDVVPGEYMHIERAQTAIAAAFDEALESYPKREP